MRKKLLLILALTILVASTLVGCSEASSNPSTLTILSITEGDVFVMKAGTDSWTEAQVGMSLEAGDSIKTGDGSGAEITFFDGSTIELQAGTEIEITSLDISTDGATTITLMQTIGTTISRVTKLLDPASSYEVETPTGAAVVRGSWLTVIVEYITPQIIKTWIINQEGTIWAIGQGVKLQVPEGQTCIIMFGQPPNLMPLAEDDAAITDEDTPVTVAAPGVLNNDSDPDVGDTLTVTSMNTSGTVGTVTAWAADGSFTYDPNGQFEYMQAGGSTTDSFTYTVSDGNGGTDTATVTITINGVNDAPVARNDYASTNEDTPVTFPAPGVLYNDSDPDVGDTLTVTAVDQGATRGAVTDWKADNSFTYNPNGQFEYLQAGGSTTDSFTYGISDGNGGTDYATVTITITGVNDPPLAVDDSATTQQGTPVTINVLNNDSDIDGDTLTVDSVTPGTHGSVTNNGNDVTYTPNSGFSGTDTFTYTISDGNGGTDTATVTVTVIETPATPATIGITVDQGPTAFIFIWDNTDNGWVTQGNHETPDTIEVAGGHSYCVWVVGDVTRYVNSCPNSWSGVGTETACGVAEAGVNYPVHFTQH